MSLAAVISLSDGARRCRPPRPPLGPRPRPPINLLHPARLPRPNHAGAGVLSLPYSVAMLGYPGGVAALLVFSWATLYTSQLLVDVNEVKGQRMRSYTQCVQAILGHRSMVALAVLQQSNLVLTALAYSITASYALQ